MKYVCLTVATLPQSRHVKSTENSISVLQKFMKFYANLCQVIIFYANVRKCMLCLKFYAGNCLGGL